MKAGSRIRTPRRARPISPFPTGLKTTPALPQRAVGLLQGPRPAFHHGRQPSPRHGCGPDGAPRHALATTERLLDEGALEAVLVHVEALGANVQHRAVPA